MNKNKRHYISSWDYPALTADRAFIASLGGGSVPVTPVPFGTLVQNDFTSGAGHWITVGTPGVTFASDGITMNGSAGRLSDYIYYDSFSGLSNAKFEITANILSNSPTIEFGFIGRGQIFIIAKGFVVELGATTNDFYSITKSPPNTPNFFPNTGNVLTTATLAGDVLKYSIEMVGNIFTITHQINGGVINSASYANPFTTFSSGFVLPSAYAPVIFNVSANMKITELKVSSTTLKNIDKLCVGDSITQGFFSGTFAGRFASILGIDVNAGGGNTTQDLINRLPELIAQNPKKVYLLIGVNDTAGAISSGVWQANIVTITNAFEAIGATVIHLLYAGFGAYGTSVNNFITSTYPTKYIDTATPLETSPGVISATYDAGDEHPNAAGHSLIASTIMASPLY